MDDKAVGWIVGGILIIILIAAAMAAVAIIAAVAAGAYGLYQLAKYFAKQIRTKYKLTSTSIMVLVVVGFITATTLSAICASLDSTLEQVALGVVSPAILLGILVLTVASWGWAKRSGRLAPTMSDLNTLKKQISSHDREIGIRQREIDDLQTQIKNINSKYGRKMEEAQGLEESIKQICLKDARLLVLKRREWESTLSKLPEEGLSSWQNCTEDSDTASRLKSLLVAREKLNRQTSSSASRLPKLEARLLQLSKEKQTFQSEKKRLGVELQMYEQQKEGIRQERIVLD
jgi:hypothetical protein